MEYEGNVTQWDEKDGTHYIEYQDGESHWQDLAEQPWRLLMVSVEDTYRRCAKAKPVARKRRASKEVDGGGRAAAPAAAPGPRREDERSQLQVLTVSQLKVKCRGAGLPVTGRKAELIDSLMAVK